MPDWLILRFLYFKYYFDYYFSAECEVGDIEKPTENCQIYDSQGEKQIWNNFYLSITPKNVIPLWTQVLHIQQILRVLQLKRHYQAIELRLLQIVV
jgi:hypothetical protein